MKDLSYVISIWLIGVFISPILVYFFWGMGDEFISLYFLFVVFGGMFSIITALIFIGVYFLIIRQNFKTIFKIKLATNIAVVVLTLLTFFMTFYWLNFFNNEALLMSLAYILTMSIAVWLLKLKIDKKEEIPFVDDDVL